ncbi:MAG: hypothetical protein ACFCU5_18570 [Pleurocapsa sp.]
MNDRLIDRTELAINSFLAGWFEQHPSISWIVGHPLISLIASLVILILLIRLFVAVYKLIINFIDRLWLWILRSPWLLIKFLFGWEVKPKPETTATSITNYQVTSDSELLTKICDRLTTIERQQQHILQEITSLKKQAKNVNHKAIELVLPESKITHQ